VKAVVTVPWGERLGGAENMLWAFLRRLATGRLRDVRRLGASVRALASLMRAERPDLILNWIAKAQVYGGAAAALAGMSDRVVWWQHSVSDGHWLDRAATLVPACAVGCSSSAVAAAQASLRPRRRTFVVHPGVDPASNGPRRQRAPRARTAAR
jgi:hypothetical protein